MTEEKKSPGNFTPIQWTMGSVKGAMSATAAGKTDLWVVSVGAVRVLPEFNVRLKDAEYQQAVRQLADSFKANGYYRDKPMAGYVALENGENVIYLTDGFTRMDGLKLAASEGCEIEQVPVIISPKGTSMEDITVAFVTKNSGRNLRPMEIAEVCKRLVGYGLEVPEIARRLCFTETYVANLLTLLESPRQIRDMVATGKVSATLAIEMVKKHGSDALAMLKSAEQTASEAGKEKVTKKHVGTAVGVPKKVKVNPFKSGLSFIKEQKLDGDERFLDFLGAISGKTREEILQALIEPEKADKKAKKEKPETKADPEGS